MSIDIAALIAAEKFKAAQIRELVALRAENNKAVQELSKPFVTTSVPSPTNTEQAVIRVATTVSPTDSTALIKPASKRDQLIQLAIEHITKYGDTHTKDLVKVVEENEPSLLEKRGDKRVAVSQALSDLKEVFVPSRKTGWGLVSNNPKSEKASVTADAFSNNNQASLHAGNTTQVLNLSQEG